MSEQDCAWCEERLPDLVDGTLGPVMAAEVRRHLGRCAPCRDLQAALVLVASELGRVRPTATVETGLEERIARQSFRRQRRAADLWPFAPALGGPPWRVQAGAAVLSLAVTGAVFLWSSAVHGAASAPARAFRSVNRTATDFRSRTDGLMEDLRLVRVLVSTAFEGRLDRVQEQVEDYRRMLERRRRAQPGASPVPKDRTPGPQTS